VTLYNKLRMHLMLGNMDTHLQHPRTVFLRDPSQRLADLSASTRIAMDVLAASEGHDPSSPYVELFAQIAALQAKGDHYGLIQAAERADLAVCPPLCCRICRGSLILLPFKVTHDNNPKRLLLTMPLVMSCLIVNDLSAEFHSLL
jgi:hypothetical protein